LKAAFIGEDFFVGNDPADEPEEHQDEERADRRSDRPVDEPNQPRAGCSGEQGERHRRSRYRRSSGYRSRAPSAEEAAHTQNKRGESPGRASNFAGSPLIHKTNLTHSNQQSKSEFIIGRRKKISRNNW
jgi:hypothetical protein